MCRKQAEIEWAWRGISIVACCHSVKLCILVPWAFQSQQSGAVTRMWSGAMCNFHKKMCDRCGPLQKGTNVVATSQLMLRWKCNSPQMRCALRATHKYMWREQAITEWSRRVIFFTSCCHSVKLCALAIRAFWSQHKKYTSLSFTCLIHENGRRWICTWIEILRHFNILMDLDVINFAWTDLGWNWVFSFELYRNFRFSFGTTAYCWTTA